MEVNRKGVLVIDECGNPEAGNCSDGVDGNIVGILVKLRTIRLMFIGYFKNGCRLLLFFRLYLLKI